MTRVSYALVVLLVATALPSCIFRVERPVQLDRDGAAGATLQQDKSARATPKEDDEDPADAAAKIAQLERSLALAQARLEKERADLASAEQSSQDALAAAEAELGLARRALESFEGVQSKIRLEKERLSLTGAEDRVAEDQEELQQLELMYEKADLADRTKELVVRRTKRRIERSEASLAIQRREMEALQELEIPMERAKLALDVESKTRGLERARRDASSSRAEARISVMSQEHDVAKATEDLAAAKRAAAKSASGSKRN